MNGVVIDYGNGYSFEDRDVGETKFIISGNSCGGVF